MELPIRKPTHDGVDVVADALEYKRKADELKELAIEQLLAQREQIDSNLKILGYANGNGTGHVNGHVHTEKTSSTTQSPPRVAAASQRFRGMPLADAVRIILTEQGTQHGKNIERICLAGGYQTETQKFQNYLAVALKRAGGFENRGRNIWRLNPEIAPQQR